MNVASHGTCFEPTQTLFKPGSVNYEFQLNNILLICLISGVFNAL